tara:strand:- start:1308 stop:2669 length:1362 start_codon:yes stop_codon:yes gene_type:complete
MSKNNSVDVLNLEWSSSNSRDRIAASLVCNYLRIKGLKVKEGFIFNGYKLIDKYKPKLMFITNSVGADINLKLVQYCISKKIPCISLVAEGNFMEGDKNTRIFTWGVNRKELLFENFTIQWSRRTRDASLKLFPELQGRIKVSGSVNTDLYKIKTAINKNSFIKKHEKNRYERIVGVGCWDFGILDENDHRYKLSLDQYGADAVNCLKLEKEKFNTVLKKIIAQNPEVLFLLKKHPGSMKGDDTSGILGLREAPNTLIIKNEESIFNVISVSDFWITFESTTALEAWLLGKQTCLLNPTKFEWKRDEIFKGSPIYRSVDELQNSINIFFLKNELPGFKMKRKTRRNLIKYFSEFDDGLNHVRVGNFILYQLTNKQEFVKLEFRALFLNVLKFKQIFLWYFGKYFLFIPYVKKIENRKKHFNDEEIMLYSKQLLADQKAFYKGLNLDSYQVVDE